jgi:hypothetical protein
MKCWICKRCEQEEGLGEEVVLEGLSAYNPEQEDLGIKKDKTPFVWICEYCTTLLWRWNEQNKYVDIDDLEDRIKEIKVDVQLS